MNRRERLMLMIAIAMLGGIIFKFMIHDPQQAQHETLAAVRDAAQAELDKDERIVARSAQARAEYERVRTYIAAVEQKLPQRKEIPALLTTMEQFTHHVGVSFESIHPGTLAAVNAPQNNQAAPGGQGPAAAARPRGTLPADTHVGKSVPYSSMPVDISLRGTFAQTVQYLKELRNFPRLVIVDSVALNPSGFPHLGITIKAEIFTLGTPDQASDGQPAPAPTGQGGH